MIKVGITGGIGCGKTTVCKIFEAMGVPVYYADDRAKKLMSSDKKVKMAIIALLGKDAYFGNGRLNRKFISAKIFNDKKLLQKLNKIVHPAVQKDGDKWFARQKTVFAIKEAALLIESASYKSLDLLILVTAPVALRISRVMQRDKSDRQSVERRIKNQLSDAEKAKFANFIIINDGKKSLIAQVTKIYKKLMK